LQGLIKGDAAFASLRSSLIAEEREPKARRNAVSQHCSEEGKQEYPYRGIPLPYLRELRQSRGLSQRELGELARVSSGTVFRLENGLRGAYPGTVRKLATALGVAPEELVHGKST
jgi:DNA-binding XRE family transcriptional regulator